MQFHPSIVQAYQLFIDDPSMATYNSFIQAVDHYLGKDQRDLCMVFFITFGGADLHDYAS